VIVEHLEVIDFRNYTSGSFDLTSGTTVVVGDNGQGKTNLVEALGYLATLSSFRGAPNDAMVRMGVGLARTLDSGPASQTLINHLVSMAIERATLTKLDGEREFDFLGGTVAQRINELKAEREQIRPITAGLQNWLLGASDTEVIAYFNRLNTYGELSAMKWLKQRQPAQP